MSSATRCDGNAVYTHGTHGRGLSAAGARTMGVFTRVGTHQTISVVESPESYFHDPTNAYTEAHSVFTDSLKMRGT